ncbi:MAG: hypothetical protein MJZ57_09025 [Bacteroidales bacterium]|nr:hypothetical protein [Bacteroidales bacterium]
MKKLVCVFLLLVGATFAYSQKFVVPEIKEGIEKSEYVNYEKDFLSCQNWLENNGPTASLRKDVNSYVLWWVSGTPDIKMEVNSDILNFNDGNLMLLFLGGWAKQTIENKYDLSLVDGNLAGLRTVINYYNKYQKVLGKNKEIEKLVQMESKGTLEEFVRSVVK